jgi:hydrogenase maturation protein HypF
LQGPVIGVTFDGSGCGTDGAVWGGEFLVGDYQRFRRAAQLRYVGMPGAQQAVRQPWRMAAAHLLDAGCNFDILSPEVSPVALAALETMIARRANTPLTSSAGRLFDAVAALAGVRQKVSYEGQAAMECEWLASELTADAAYPYETIDEPGDFGSEPTCIVDTRPLIRAVVRDKAKGAAAGRIARRFQSTLVEIVADICGRIANRTGLDRVVLSGGVFANVLLTVEAAAHLDRQGLRVYRHQLVPPNDGGLSLGQLAIAAAD